MASCHRLQIGVPKLPIFFLIQRGADCQSAAGCQPWLPTCPTMLVGWIHLGENELMLKLNPTWLALPFLLALTACSEAPKTDKAKVPETPPEPVTGRQAFQKMYPPARGWALHAVPLQLKTINLPQTKAAKANTPPFQA